MFVKLFAQNCHPVNLQILMSPLLTAVLLIVVCQSKQPTVVDLTSADTPIQIAVQICSGLYNNNSSNNGVYTFMQQPQDSEWLQDLYNITNPSLTTIDTFLSECLSSKTAVGYIRYNYTQQNEITPNLITLAAIFRAILLEDNSPFIKNATLIFDALSDSQFGNSSALKVSQYMYQHYINQTTTLAFMNPNPVNPGLTDYIVKERIFNFYLGNACIRGTPEYDFVLKMVNPSNNPWNNPINVMGYNDAWPVAGDLFEAETDCDSLHNMGQVASDGFNNLAFMSRTPSINKPFIQNPSSSMIFNQSKIYLSFTIGDGDNLNYLKSSRRDWIKDRVSKCEQDPDDKSMCFPLQWSISPHIIYLSPLMLEWYYNQSYITKHDYFVLPPSGHLYAYPSEMDYDTAQKNFIQWTERDCKILGCNATVAWEFVFTWNKAIKNYFPRYGVNKQNQTIYGLFAVNVPYNVPVYDFWFPLEFYKILDNDLVLFKPREWRGTNMSHDGPCVSGVPLSFEFCFPPQDMALEINEYPKGTITQIYITSDGGGNLQMIYDLVPLLNEYVEIVSPTQLIDLALQANHRNSYKY